MITVSIASLSCGGPGRPVEPPAPAADPADAGSAADAAASGPAGDAGSSGAGDGAGEAPKDAWRVRITRGGATTAASWPALEHEWRADSPDALVADRTLCVPKGRYVFEERSSPSLDLDLDVGGRRVITQRDFPTEISRPLALDGCVTVHAALRNPLHFAGISFRLRLRPAAPEIPACEDTYPKASWNACLYAGRNQEELIGREAWSKLAVPGDQKPGDNGQFDWMSIVARRTICFAPGDYIFHSRSDDTLRVFVGDAPVIDAPPTRRLPVMESRPTALRGCAPVRVVHSYRFGLSTLDLAWAKVGSPQDRAWSAERACGFNCDDESRCTSGDKLAPEVKGRHLCVPFHRRSREGEYCDRQHPCEGSMCIRATCRGD